MKVISQKSKAAITEQYFKFNPSFGPFLRFLKMKLEETQDIRSKFYRYLVKKFEQQPQLLRPFKNIKVLEQHDDLVQLLSASLRPLSAKDDDVPMALAFMQPSCLFYYTTSFKQTFINNRIEFDTKEDKISNLRYFVKLVLERCYAVKVFDIHKIIKQVNLKGKTIKHYQLNIESRFIDVNVKGGLPPWQDEWYKICNAEDKEFLTLFKQFPADQFTLEGFCMFSIDDVSKEMALEQLKNAILNMHTTSHYNTLANLEMAMGELLNDPGIRIGITPFFKINGKTVFERSLMTSEEGTSAIENSIKKGASIESIYQKFTKNPEPYVLSSLDKEFVISRPSIGDIESEHVKKYLIYPIQDKRHELLGVFELEKENLTSKTIDLLQPAIPLVTDVFYYLIQLFDNKIASLVKEKFTPLQQSVEWKFTEVAWQYFRNDFNKKPNNIIGDIVFEQVYPLYGAIDIRDLSIERNYALREDYKIQLTTTLDLLEQTSQETSLPLVDSIKYKCIQFIELVNDTLTTEDELKISDFFQYEVKTFFNYLQNRYPTFSNQLSTYFEKTDPVKGEFHVNRSAYEASVQIINKGIVAYFDDEVKKQQSIYPFYFEKYRTDGVEYNIYIGQSIVPDKKFDIIYLRNLRLWQLTSMAHISRTNHQMVSSLPVTLRTTQLILVHNPPIDISFRKDERRFDVEGSYNIRYEMLKKRIDKVRVKTTLERLTQPDKISIVYSNAMEAEEYLEHIHFLQSKEILEAAIETLDLENLQGVTGLKALRVGVKE